MGTRVQRQARIRHIAGLALVVAGLCAAALPTLAQAWVPGQPGRIAYAGDDSAPGDVYGYGSHIWTINSDGSGRQELTHGDDNWPSWSPNGHQIAFSRNEPSTGWRVWIMSDTGADQHALTPPGTPGTYPYRGNIMPQFSPDGTRIAFVSVVLDGYPSGPVTNNQQVWVMNADGSGMHQITFLPETEIKALSWSPDSSHLLFWARDIVHPSTGDYGALSAPYHIYEMTSEGGDIHQIAWSPAPPLLVPGWLGVGEEGDQVGGLDWSPRDIAITLPFEGTHFSWGVADGSPPTGIPTDGGTMLSPSWSPDSVVRARLVYSWSDSGDRFAIGGGGDPFQLHTFNPSQQLTFDDTDHINPAWGPVPSGRRVPTVRPTFALINAVERGSRTVRVLLPCPASAGSAGCFDRLLASSGSGGNGSSSYTFKLKRGSERVVSLRLSQRLKGTLRVGSELRLVLHAKMRGKTTVMRQRDRVFAPASVAGRCQVQKVQLGSSVTLSGDLHVSPVGNGSAADSAGKRVGLVAVLNPGLTQMVSAKTNRQGHYSLRFRPAEPGVWAIRVIWNGDRNHATSQGPECGALVTVPRQQTALTLSCPGKSGVGVPLAISGNITPAIEGVSIKLTYTHQTQGPLQTFTSTVKTDGSGHFSDASIKPEDPGQWYVSAAYAGDRAWRPSSSQPCAISVS